MLCSQIFTYKKFSLIWYSVFCLMSSISVCHCLKSVIYKKLCMCVCACVHACVRACVMQNIKVRICFRTRCRRSSKSHRIKNSSAHRQYIKNLTFSRGRFTEEKPYGSKCIINGTLKVHECRFENLPMSSYSYDNRLKISH